MHLFKSDWLHQTRHSFRLPTVPLFARRYGLVVDRASARPVTPPARTCELTTVEHERAVMRYLAQVERAA